MDKGQKVEIIRGKFRGMTGEVFEDFGNVLIIALDDTRFGSCHRLTAKSVKAI